MQRYHPLIQTSPQLRRLIPSILFVAAVTYASYLFALTWTPPDRAARLMPSLSFSHATTGPHRARDEDVSKHQCGHACESAQHSAGNVDGEEVSPANLLVQRNAHEAEYQHVDKEMADGLVAEDAAEVAKGADHGGNGGEVAVEDSPGGWEAPREQGDDVDADDAKDRCMGEG